MKKLCVFVLVLVLLAGCILIPEGGSSLNGKWALSSVTLRVLEDYESGYITQELGFYPEFDNYYSGPVMEVDEEMLAVYMNLTSSPVFGMVGIGSDIIASEDSLYLTMGENDLVSSIIPSDTFGVAYTITDDGELSLLYEIMDDHLDIPEISIEVKFEEYVGSLPRDSWLNYMERDNYEIDSIIVIDTTIIALDERQSHTLSHEDRDVFEFIAYEDSFYTAHVMSNMYTNITLYDSLGTELHYSVRADSLETMESSKNELLGWKANYTGIYYLMVDGSVGYYDMVIEELDESLVMGKENSFAKKVDKNKITRESIESYLIEMMEEK